MKTKRWNLICQGSFLRSYLHSRHPLSPERNPQRKRETSAFIHRGKSSETAHVTEESCFFFSAPPPQVSCSFLPPFPLFLSLKSYTEKMPLGLIRHLWFSFASVTVREKKVHSSYLPEIPYFTFTISVLHYSRSNP
jgi:hypothetical protein